MIPVLYNASETEFNSGGLGFLVDCISCKVTTERNGSYECEFSYPISGQLYQEITLDRIIKAKADETSDLQLFRLYKNSKPINGIVKFYAQHISYDLCGNSVPPLNTDVKVNAVTALQLVLDNCYYQHNFRAVSTNATRAIFQTDVPCSARKCLGGMDGSILETYGGEFEFDNFVIKLHSERGSDNGVAIRYGKNLTEIKADSSTENTYTAICPYAVDSEGDLYQLPERIIELDTVNNYGEPRILHVDFSRYFESDEDFSIEDLRTFAVQYAIDNKIEDIYQNITVSFVQLWQSKEYEQIALLERVRLCDTVTVSYPKLGVNVKAKCIKTVYDALKEQYDSIELGEAKSTFGDTISKTTSNLQKMGTAIVEQKSALLAAVDRATKAITGQSGGYVVMQTGEGYTVPSEILIMNTPDILTATKLWRWNLGGLGYSKNGYNGPFGTAITMNGEIVADFITAGSLNADIITSGTLNANLIKAGTLSSINNTFKLNLTNGIQEISLDNSRQLKIWGKGITFYDTDGETTLTSMYISTNGRGVLTANRCLFGKRDSERIDIYTNDDGTVGTIATDNIIVRDTINSLSVTNLTGTTINTTTIKCNNKNALYADTDGYTDINVLAADRFLMGTTTIQKDGSYVSCSSPIQTKGISIKANDSFLEAGSFYVGASGTPYLKIGNKITAYDSTVNDPTNGQVRLHVGATGGDVSVQIGANTHIHDTAGHSFVETEAVRTGNIVINDILVWHNVQISSYQVTDINGNTINVLGYTGSSQN